MNEIYVNITTTYNSLLSYYTQLLWIMPIPKADAMKSNISIFFLNTETYRRADREQLRNRRKPRKD